ncbi:hypothetical protein HGRIS_011433 [Hohenbuehelia grisea]|uniref:F-box domain-containing protein n=1 Tax=Hohenbuehelia grisea TaxID=104357 RepID=A0ABR3JVA5_9AGAR
MVKEIPAAQLPARPEELEAPTFPAPASRLPIELLSEIFICLTKIHSNKTLKFDTKRRFPQWHVSCVCRSWRAAALATSQLWSSIALRLAKRYTPGQTALFTAALERSGQAFLHIRVFNPFMENYLEYDPLLALLVAQAHRWRKLVLLNEFYCHLPHPFEQVKGKLPRLRTLKLCSSLEAIHTPNVITDLFAETPALVDLTIEKEYTGYFILPWQNIQKLKLCKDGDADAVPHLDSLLLPSLRDLHVDVDGEDDFNTFMPRIPPLVVRSECCLASLTLHSWHGGGGGLIDFLRDHTFASLTSLCIRAHKSIASRLFTALTSTDADQPHSVMLPALERLQVQAFLSDDAREVDTLTHDAMMGMLESRCLFSVAGGITQLIYFAFDGYPRFPMSEDHGERLNTLIEDGLYFTTLTDLK